MNLGPDACLVTIINGKRGSKPLVDSVGDNQITRITRIFNSQIDIFAQQCKISEFPVGDTRVSLPWACCRSLLEHLWSLFEGLFLSPIHRSSDPRHLRVQ